MVLRNTRALFTPMCPSLNSVWTLALWWGYPSTVGTSFLPVGLNLKGTAHGFKDACLIHCTFHFINRALGPVVFEKMKRIFFKQWKFTRVSNHFFCKMTCTTFTTVQYFSQTGLFLAWLRNKYTVDSLQCLSFLYFHVGAMSASNNLESKTKVSALEGMKGLPKKRKIWPQSRTVFWLKKTLFPVTNQNWCSAKSTPMQDILPPHTPWFFFNSFERSHCDILFGLLYLNIRCVQMHGHT